MKKIATKNISNSFRWSPLIILIVSNRTPTSYSCNGSGYTKINDSNCYKY